MTSQPIFCFLAWLEIDILAEIVSALSGAGFLNILSNACPLRNNCFDLACLACLVVQVKARNNFQHKLKTFFS